jgi:hypothetical protein
MLPNSDNQTAERGERKWFDPSRQRQAVQRRGDVAKDQDFNLSETLHEALAIDIIKRRVQTSAQDEEIAYQKFPIR